MPDALRVFGNPDSKIEIEDEQRENMIFDSVKGKHTLEDEREKGRRRNRYDRYLDCQTCITKI